MSRTQIRQAVADDAAEIGEFQTRCWQQAYRGVVPDSYLDGTTSAMRSRRWRERIARGERRVLLMQIEGDLVGVASTVVTTPDSTDLPGLELASIYVDQKVQGSGIGSALLVAAVGNEPAHLWVFTSNGRAQRFYAKHGFQPTGEQRVDPDTGVEETRWVRDTR